VHRSVVDARADEVRGVRRGATEHPANRPNIERRGNCDRRTTVAMIAGGSHGLDMPRARCTERTRWLQCCRIDMEKDVTYQRQSESF
jgi:hypothetical protein